MIPLIHAHVTVRWKKILEQGHGADIKNQLIIKYPPFANRGSICIPKINPEVKNVISEAALCRDEHKQKQNSACLSAVGKILMS